MLFNTPRYMDFRIFKGRILGFKVVYILQTHTLPKNRINVVLQLALKRTIMRSYIPNVKSYVTSYMKLQYIIVKNCPNSQCSLARRIKTVNRRNCELNITRTEFCPSKSNPQYTINNMNTVPQTPGFSRRGSPRHLVRIPALKIVHLSSV